MNPKQRDEALMGLISTKSSDDYKCANEPDISNSYFKEVLFTKFSYFVNFFIVTKFRAKLKFRSFVSISIY